MASKGRTPPTPPPTDILTELKITLSAVDAAGDIYRFHMAFMQYFTLYRVIHREMTVLSNGIADAMILLEMGASILAASHGQLMTDDDRDLLERLVLSVASFKAAEHWEDDTDVILSCCYHLLRTKAIDHTTSAAIGKALLKPKNVSPVEKLWIKAWRTRVERWADDPKRNLPPVEIRKKLV